MGRKNQGLAKAKRPLFVRMTDAQRSDLEAKQAAAGLPTQAEAVRAAIVAWRPGEAVLVPSQPPAPAATETNELEVVYDPEEQPDPARAPDGRRPASAGRG